ncbi:transcriptional regulator ATRX homolog isoform X3 [Artemia franciscana]|uniref:Transcriptional regulator ATRX homolog n=1 Tax=Artemia franciscana TaxID=6661 RepID=A0AA88L5W7_ARTSF|nr:hypothetical protein QYM36_006771 [Artemia franciscana]
MPGSISELDLSDDLEFRDGSQECFSLLENSQRALKDNNSSERQLDKSNCTPKSTSSSTAASIDKIRNNYINLCRSLETFLQSSEVTEDLLLDAVDKGFVKYQALRRKLHILCKKEERTTERVKGRNLSSRLSRRPSRNAESLNQTTEVVSSSAVAEDGCENSKQETVTGRHSDSFELQLSSTESSLFEGIKSPAKDTVDSEIEPNLLDVENNREFVSADEVLESVPETIVENGLNISDNLVRSEKDIELENQNIGLNTTVEPATQTASRREAHTKPVEAVVNSTSEDSTGSVAETVLFIPNKDVSLVSEKVLEFKESEDCKKEKRNKNKETKNKEELEQSASLPVEEGESDKAGVDDLSENSVKSDFHSILEEGESDKAGADDLSENSVRSDFHSILLVPKEETGDTTPDHFEEITDKERFGTEIYGTADSVQTDDISGLTDEDWKGLDSSDLKPYLKIRPDLFHQERNLNQEEEGNCNLSSGIPSIKEEPSIPVTIEKLKLESEIKSESPVKVTKVKTEIESLPSEEDISQESEKGKRKKKVAIESAKSQEEKDNLEACQYLLASSEDSDTDISLPIIKKREKKYTSFEQLQKGIDSGNIVLRKCSVQVERYSGPQTLIVKSENCESLLATNQDPDDEDFDRSINRLLKSRRSERLAKRLSQRSKGRKKAVIMSDDSDAVILSSDDDVAPVKNGAIEEEVMEVSNENEADKAALLMSSDEENDEEDSEAEEEIKKNNKKGSGRQKKPNKAGSDSEKEKPKIKKEQEIEELLNTSDSDSSDFATPKQKKKQVKSDEELILDSDSSEADGTKKRNKRKKKESSDESDFSDQGEEKNTRKRLKRIKNLDSTDDEVEILDKSKDPKGRKNIKKIIKDKHLQDETRQAAREEKERIRRIAERQSLYNQVFAGPEADTNKKITKLVLDFDPETKEEVVTVHPKICENLKPHQASGIKFMWDACYETVEMAQKSEGSGCILAHCMGLGKTLQVVSLVHTLLSHENCKTRTALVVCPVSTVLNWVNEFSIWLKDELEIEVYELASAKQNNMRKIKLDAWFRTGGVMVMGYDAYRLYTNDVNKKIKGAYKQTFQKTLVNPGPDIVICDEGHILKNESSALSKAITRIKTKRRVVLTGTPLQNNLKEYHCMINFVKPNLLGTKKEFLNRFVNPIMNGQSADATQSDVKIMKRRAHVLHSMMEGSVQRKDYNVLTPFLPPKQEYVLSVMLSEPQIKMYRYYLDNLSKGGVGRGRGLFADFQALARLWTHPRAMKIAKQRQDLRKEQEESEDEMADFIDDHSDQEDTDDEIQCLDDDKLPNINWRTRTRASKGSAPIEEDDLEITKEEDKHWWDEFVPEEDMSKMELSGKLVLLFAILRACELIGDKILVFSQSLITLDVIEEFLKIEDEKNCLGSDDASYFGSWKLGLDYFRLDGSMAADQRKVFCNRFNREDNLRARLFLISTKAGGLGINLCGANRVIIFDASWNPSYDIQSIFRVYRFGQVKPVYVYRFLAQGTMEEKIYQRQVVKQSLACRVVDEQQIERHFSAADLQELYSFEPDRNENRPTPKLPKDLLLADLLQSHKDTIVTYHEHDSLLESKEDENLSEEERKAAWEEYENEKKGLVSHIQQMPVAFDPFAAYSSYQMPINTPVMPSLDTLRDYLRAQKPDMSDEELDARSKFALQEYYNLYRAMMQQQALAERERLMALQQMQQMMYPQRQSMALNMGRPLEPGPSRVKPSVKQLLPQGPTRLTEISVPLSKASGGMNQLKTVKGQLNQLKDMGRPVVPAHKNGNLPLKLGNEVTITPVTSEVNKVNDKDSLLSQALGNSDKSGK